MRHGAYCRKRSFPTKCRQCGAPVMYWECIHGCKVFMDYPIYGKAIRHRCIVNRKKKTNILLGFAEHRLNLSEKTSYQCPVCRRLFLHENDLSIHLIQLRKQDDNHAFFIEQEMNSIEIEDENLIPENNYVNNLNISKYKKSKYDSNSNFDDTEYLKNRSFRIKSKQKQQFETFLRSEKEK